MSLRQDNIVDQGRTGLGAGFAVRDAASGRLRAIAANELATTLSGAGSSTTNYGLSTVATVGGTTSANSLTLSAGGGIASGSAFGTQLTVTTGGLLAFSDNAGIGSSRITSAGVTMTLHTIGSSTLSLEGSIVNTTNGIVKADDGTLIFNRRQYYTDTAGSNGTTINGGTLRLAGGDNTILVRPTATVPTLIGLYANGGTLDLNGTTQLVERLQSVGTLPGTGGTITSTATGRLVAASSSSTTFAGSITGAVEFQKGGTGTLTMTAPSTTTGALVVRGGGLTLRDSAAFGSVPSVTVNQATLTLDNTGLSSSTTRLGSAPVSLNGGALTILSRQSTQDTQTIPSLALTGGQSTITLTVPAGSTVNGSSFDLVVTGLTRTANATLNVAAGAGTLGASGGNPRLTLTGATNTHDILGGWAIASGTTFASIGAGGVVVGLSDTAYGSSNLSTAVGPFVNVSATSAVTVTTKQVNAVRIPSALVTTLGSSGASATLTLTSGGLLLTSGSAQFAAGDPSSAITSAASGLFPFVNSGTLVLQTRVIGAIDLVKGGSGMLTLTSTGNSYTGTTFVNAGSLLLGSTAAGLVQVPGDLVIAGGASLWDVRVLDERGW